MLMRKSACNNQLLQNLTHRLNHIESVRGLHASAFQPVIKGRIFIGCEIQTGGMFHDTRTNVERIPVSKESVKVVNESAENRTQPREKEFKGNQRPKCGLLTADDEKRPP